MSATNAPKFPDSYFMTNAGNDEFDIREALSAERAAQFPVLVAAVRAEIRHLAVEFIPTKDNNPHVIFKLNFRNGFVIGNSRYIACLVSVNEQKAVDKSRGAGACVISVVPFTARSSLACAAFQFNVKAQWKLWDLVNIISGAHPRLPLQSNTRSGLNELAHFHFVVVSSPGAINRTVYRGCRDWICQVLVRLHFAGMVDWDVGGIFGTEAVPSSASEPQFQGNNYQRFLPAPGSGCKAIDWNDAGFHDIIGKNFRQPERGRFLDANGVSHVGEVVYYTEMPVKRGLLRPTVMRFTRAQNLPMQTLPYQKQAEQAAPAGASSRASGRTTSGISAPQAGSGSGHKSTKYVPIAPKGGGAGNRSTPNPAPKAGGSGPKKAGPPGSSAQ